MSSKGVATNTQLHTKSRVNRQANQGVTDILTSGPYKM